MDGIKRNLSEGNLKVSFHAYHSIGLNQSKAYFITGSDVH